MCTISLKLLNGDFVMETGVNSRNQRKFGWNNNMSAEILNVKNYEVIPNLNIKPHLYKCRENKQQMEAQMKPAKRAIHAIHTKLALSAKKPQVDNLMLQIGLMEQVGNHGIGSMVNPDAEQRSINRKLKLKMGAIEDNEVPKCEQTIDMTQFPYKTKIEEQLYFKVSDEIHLFVLLSELPKLNNVKWFADGTWTCTMNVKFIQTYIISVR